MIKVSLHDAQTQYEEDIGLINLKNFPFAGHWEYGHAPTSIWQHNWHLVFLFFLFFWWGESAKVQGWAREEWEASMIRVHGMKFPIIKKYIGEERITNPLSISLRKYKINFFVKK